MNRKMMWLIAGLLIGSIALLSFIMKRQPAELESKHLANNANVADESSRAGREMETSAAISHVPAHYESPRALKNLPAVLPASQFSGKAREAYQAVKEIPETIAQLPCYCHCDRSLGHKSLHSCFEDDHAAHCAVCVNEALTAYRLEKERGLSAGQIRERIIAEYSRQ
jgi:hypothetical protein